MDFHDIPLSFLILIILFPLYNASETRYGSSCFDSANVYINSILGLISLVRSLFCCRLVYWKNQIVVTDRRLFVLKGTLYCKLYVINLSDILAYKQYHHPIGGNPHFLCFYLRSGQNANGHPIY
jgi:hypothetical protein